MEKFDIKDIQRALDTMRSLHFDGEIQIKVDERGRLLMGFFDGFNGNEVTITIFPAESNTFAKITTTKRL